MYILTIPFPFVGVIQYYGIYVSYDDTEDDVGIHPGDNVVESGLLTSTMVQIAGILFWLGLMTLYSSPRFNDWVSENFGRHDFVSNEDGNNDDDEASSTTNHSLNQDHHPFLFCGFVLSRIDIINST